MDRKTFCEWLPKRLASVQVSSSRTQSFHRGNYEYAVKKKSLKMFAYLFLQFSDLLQFILNGQRRVMTADMFQALLQILNLKKQRKNRNTKIATNFVIFRFFFLHFGRLQSAKWHVLSLCRLTHDCRRDGWTRFDSAARTTDIRRPGAFNKIRPTCKLQLVIYKFTETRQIFVRSF